MATKILETYKQRLESMELQPSDGGCFELQAGEDLIYSKLDTGEFPDEEAMVAAVGERL